MSQINVTNLTFAYDGSYDNIFENVSFQLDTDWKLGFTGRNGRGKTTFLKLLQGTLDSGGSISASTAFEYFPYEVKDKSKLAMEVLEEVYPDFVQWRLSRELAALEVDEGCLYRPFETLSNGEQTKLLLAALFLKQNSFLLIDEPTNHLDMKGRELVSRYLGGKKGYILVSHDRAFLDGCVDHILSINKTNIEVQKGNFSSWLENKQRQDNFELAENDKLSKEVKRLKETAKEKAKWSDKVESAKYATRNSGLRADRGYVGHQSAKMMGRSKAIEGRQQNAVEEKQKLLKNLETAEELKITQLNYHSNRLALLRDVAIDYGGGPVCQGVTFTLQKGDRLALMGKNGCGKSSVLKLIDGQSIPYTGTFELGSGLKISYVPQDAGLLFGDLSDYAAAQGIDESLFKAILRKLDFARVQFEKDMSAFSDGQKKKVLIAKSLCQQAHLHIWDEPMNFIDVISRIQIEELLLKFKPTIVFVEHDKVFCDKIATKIVELR